MTQCKQCCYVRESNEPLPIAETRELKIRMYKFAVYPPCLHLRININTVAHDLHFGPSLTTLFVQSERKSPK